MTAPATDPGVVLKPGAVLADQYQIVKLLGAGGAGEVFLAQDIALNRPVAIKLLRSKLSERFEHDARFRQEARLLSRLNHPNVVVLYAFGRSPDNEHYIVMEYISGTPLDVYLESHDTMPPEELCHVVSQVASAIDEAHRHGIVHRDLKPGNIILCAVGGDDRYIKVVDFGLAKVFQDSSAHEPEDLEGLETHERELSIQQHNVMGSPAFMAPEQTSGGEVDGRADIYALGVTACVLLTGKLPFEADSLISYLFAHLRGEPGLPSNLNPSLGIEPDSEVDAVFTRVLHKDPEQRYASGADFAKALWSAIQAWRPESFAHLRGIAPSPRPTPAAHPPLLVRALGAEADEVLEKREVLRLFRTVTTLNLVLDTRYEPPPRTAQEMDEYVDCISLLETKLDQAVDRFDGVSLGPLSDRWVLVFGLEPGDDHQVESAVDAAMSLRHALLTLRNDPTLPVRFGLTFRIGLESGRLLLIRNEEGSLVAHGAPLVNARRIAESASADDLLISENLFRRVRDLYHCPRHRDGGAGLPATHQVRIKRTLAVASTHQLHDLELALIGRVEEVATLHESMAWCMAEQGRTQVVSVSGPRGIGKSRIVLEFVRQVLDSPEYYRVYIGRCSPRQQNSPFAPFIEAIRNHARFDDGDSEDMAAAKLEQYFRQKVAEDATSLTDEEQELFRFLRRLIGLERREPAHVTTMDEDEDRGRMLTQMIALLGRLASSYPMILVLEDFQHASRATRILVRALASGATGQSVFFVLVEQTDSGSDVSFLESGTPSREIQVGPLPEDTMRELIQHMLRQLEHVPELLVGPIAALAAGVPLVVEETLLDLVDSGVIVIDEGAWSLHLDKLPEGKLPLPDTVEALYATRLERLDATQRQVLEAASVAGGRFWPEMLESMLSSPSRVREHLAELARRGLLVMRRDVVVRGEPAFEFAQASVRDALDDALSDERRRHLHKRAALWLERSVGGNLAGFEARVGAHWRRAGEPRKALTYLHQAAGRASEMLLVEEAIEHLERCFRLLESISRDAMDREERSALRVRLSAELVHQLSLTESHTRVVSVANRVAERRARGQDEAELLAQMHLEKGQASRQLGELDDALEAFDRAIEYAALIPGVHVLKLLSATARAEINLHFGAAPAAIGLLELTLDQQQRHASQSTEWAHALARCFKVLGEAELKVDAFTAAEDAFIKACQMASRARATVPLVEARMGLGEVNWARREVDRAEANWQLAFDTAAEKQLLPQKAASLVKLGRLYLFNNEVDRATAALEMARDIYALLQSSEALCEVLALLTQTCETIEEAWNLAMQAMDSALESATPQGIQDAYEVADNVARRLFEERTVDAIIDRVLADLERLRKTLAEVGLVKLSGRARLLAASLMEHDSDDTTLIEGP